jgi:EmrB/QacA subfamily drug resistance transporter
VSIRGWRHSARRANLADAAPADEADPKTRLNLTLAAASLCIFVVDLDFFALNVALPQMASGLHTTTTNLQWVISGYLLALAAFLVPGGRLGDILGRKRMLQVGLVIFGLSSLGGGLGQDASVVIGFRIVQGVGAAILFPLAIAVITDAFPPERTMRAIGNAYGIGAVAMAAGPMFGGGLTELIDWRVVLLVNVPASAAAIAVVAIGVRESRDTTVPRSIDLPGLVAVVLGIALLTFAVDRSNQWSTVTTLAVAAIGLLSLVAFVLRERRATWPLVGLDLFRNRAYVLVTLMATVANVAFVVATFVITLYLQQVKGYSPFEAGIIFLAASVATGVAGPAAGRLGERFDIPRTITVATVVGSVGLFVLSLGGALGPYLAALALVGGGFGIGWAMASVGTQTVVPPERAGQASGVTLSIVIGLAGLAVSGAAVLIETGPGLGTSIDDLLLGLAIGSAAIATILGLVASRLTPGRVVAVTATD